MLSGVYNAQKLNIIKSDKESLALQPVASIIGIHTRRNMQISKRYPYETKHANQQTDRHTVRIMLSLHVLCANNALKVDDLV
jgi:hypothetical protein